MRGREPQNPSILRLEAWIDGFRTAAEMTQRLLALITIGRIDSIDYSGNPTRVYSAMVRLNNAFYDVRIVLSENGDILAVSINKDERLTTRPLEFQPDSVNQGPK